MAVGLNIQLPHEQHSNPYQTHSLMYEHFAPRKMAFVAHSAAFVVYPGGFGTLDELFEVLTLVQTQKIGHRPVKFDRPRVLGRPCGMGANAHAGTRHDFTRG